MCKNCFKNEIFHGVEKEEYVIFWNFAMGRYVKSRDKRWHLIKKKKKIKGIMYWKHYWAEYFSPKRLTIAACTQIDIIDRN